MHNRTNLQQLQQIQQKKKKCNKPSTDSRKILFIMGRRDSKITILLSSIKENICFEKVLKKFQPFLLFFFKGKISTLKHNPKYEAEALEKLPTSLDLSTKEKERMTLET